MSTKGGGSSVRLTSLTVCCVAHSACNLRRRKRAVGRTEHGSPAPFAPYICCGDLSNDGICCVKCTSGKVFILLHGFFDGVSLGRIKASAIIQACVGQLLFLASRGLLVSLSRSFNLPQIPFVTAGSKVRGSSTTSKGCRFCVHTAGRDCPAWFPLPSLTSAFSQSRRLFVLKEFIIPNMRNGWMK